MPADFGPRAALIRCIHDGLSSGVWSMRRGCACGRGGFGCRGLCSQAVERAPPRPSGRVCVLSWPSGCGRTIASEGRAAEYRKALGSARVRVRRGIEVHWDWLLRSYSVVAPKGKEGWRPLCFGCGRRVSDLKDLKVGFRNFPEQRRRGRANQYGSTVAHCLRSPGEPHERSRQAQRCACGSCR
jgi:hypothetical protein